MANRILARENGVSSEPETSARRAEQPRLSNASFALNVLAIVLLSCVINIAGINRSEVIDDHELLHSKYARGCGRNPLDCFINPTFRLYYRPVLGASFSIGENLHGQDPLPFHVENIVFHAAAVLEACLAFRLIIRRDRAALLAGLLFAIHPLQVPVTTFIGGRTDTLTLVFVFGFIITLIEGESGRFKWVWRSASVVAFTAAVFTKEQCIPLLLLAPLLTGLGQESGSSALRPLRSVQPWMLLYLVPVGLFVVAAHQAIPPAAIDVAAWRPTPGQVTWDLGLRIEMVARTLAYYARACVWPTPYTLHQSTLGPWDIPQPGTALAGFFAAGVWIAITVHTWSDPVKRLFTLWTILTIGPCLNIVPIPSQFVSCYRAAIPLFGAAGLLGLLCDGMISGLSARFPRALALSFTFAVAATLTLLSILDVPYWRNDLVLTKVQIDSDPNFLPGFAGYALSLRKIGKRGEAIEVNNQIMDRLFPSQKTLQERVEVIDSPWMLRNMKSQSSLRYYPRPFLVFVMRERGGGEQELGLYSAAIEDYRLALAVQPDDYEVAEAMIYCLEVSGRYDEAEDALEALVARAPNSARWLRLGKDYSHTGSWRRAKECLAKALACAVRERSANAPEILKLYERAEARAGLKPGR